MEVKINNFGTDDDNQWLFAILGMAALIVAESKQNFEDNFPIDIAEKLEQKHKAHPEILNAVLEAATPVLLVDKLTEMQKKSVAYNFLIALNKAGELADRAFRDLPTFDPPKP